MNVLTVTRSDFRNVRRSRLLWTTIGVLAFTFAVIVLTQRVPDGESEQAALRAIGKMFGLTALLLPVVVIPLGALSITSERTSGSIKYLLGLPNTRSSVFVAKVASRCAVAVLGILSASLVAGLLMMVKFGTVPRPEFETFVALTTYYGLIWTTAAVAVSALSSSRARALSGTLGLYFLFGIVWNFLPSFNSTMIARFLVEDLLSRPATPNLYALVELLSPTFAYIRVSQAYVFEMQLFETASGSAFYLQDWFTLVIMAVWAALLLGVGYLGFKTARIG